MVDETQGTNEVDTSPERVEGEWESIESEENLNPSSINEDTGEVTYSDRPDDVVSTRDGSVEKLSGLLSIGFLFGFAWTAPAWQVGKEECEKLGLVWSRVLAKYLPLSWLRFIPDMTGGEGSECLECDAIAVTIMIVKPRLDKPLKSEQQPGRPGQAVQDEPGTETQSNMVYSKTDVSH